MIDFPGNEISIIKDKAIGQGYAVRSAFQPIKSWGFTSRKFSMPDIEHSCLELVRQRIAAAIQKLNETIDFNRNIHGGIPVLKDTRMPIGNIFAELSGGMDIEAIAEEYDLSAIQLKSMLDGFALYLNQSFGHERHLPTR